MTEEPRRRFQIFISSTYNDLADIRLQIIQQLFKINCIPVGMEMFPATNATSWDLITDIIDDSDYVVVVVAQRYGTPDPTGISYTQREFEYANASDKHVLVFRQELDAAEEAALEEPMRVFRDKVAIGRNFRPWKSTAELPGLIAASLTFAMGARDRPEGWIRSGYAMSEHVRRIHELTETMNTRIDALLSLATAERRGTHAMGHYMRIQQLKLDLADRNPMFALVADGLMEDPFKTLSNLANGHASVPFYQIGHANQLLIDAITSRFDAVSYDDLTFWSSEDQTDKAYRNVIYEATRRPVNPIVATRIFIFPLRVVIERRDELSSVLFEQMREGMHWAVAVEEDERAYRPKGSRPDFALFDRQRAISYFRRERQFDVTFNTNERDRHPEESEIELHTHAYRVLLTHCWLATPGFVTKHLATGEEASLLARITGRTRALKDLKFEHAGRLFPLTVESEDEIRAAIDQMVALRAKVLARR